MFSKELSARLEKIAEVLPAGEAMTLKMLALIAQELNITNAMLNDLANQTQVATGYEYTVRQISIDLDSLNNLVLLTGNHFDYMSAKEGNSQNVNELGAERWKMVGMTVHDDVGYAIFMRETFD